MKDDDKSEEQLINELVELRQKLAELEASEAKHKQIEGALQESEERYRSLVQQLDKMLQTMVDGMVMVDLAGEITYANRAAEHILEIHKDDITGRYYYEQEWRPIDEHGEPYPPEQLPLSIALREQHEVDGLEHGVVAPDGEVKWLSVNAAPLLDERGQLCGAITSFRDITPRRRAEDALRRRNRELTMLNHVIAALTYLRLPSRCSMRRKPRQWW
jgi:PAS domain S-box-containing protein